MFYIENSKLNLSQCRQTEKLNGPTLWKVVAPTTSLHQHHLHPQAVTPTLGTATVGPRDVTNRASQNPLSLFIPGGVTALR